MRFQRGATFNQGDILEEKALFEPGTVKMAEDYYKKTRIGKKNGESYGFMTDLTELEVYGQGPFSYFIFMKYTTVVLFCMGLFTLAPMYLYSRGGGLGGKADGNVMLTTSIGNLKSTSLTYSESVIAKTVPDFQSTKDSEYRDYSRIAMFSDVAYSLIFLLYSYWMRTKTAALSQQIEMLSKSAADYALEVRNIPPDTTKEEVEAYFARFGCTINQVNFAFKFSNTLGYYMKLADNRIRKKLHTVKYANNPKYLAELIKEQDLKYKEIASDLKDAISHLPSKGKNLDVTDMANLEKLKVFIIFEHPSAPAKVKELHDRYLRRRGCFCCKSSNAKMLFRGKELELTFPDHPANIMWENLEISNVNRFLRSVLVAIMSLVLMLACFIVIFLLNVASENASQSEKPCSDTIIKQDQLSFLDSNTDEYKDLNYCFCKQQSLIDLTKNSLCDSYLRDFLIQTGLSIVGGLIIAITNFLLKKILFYFSKFQVYRSLTAETTSTIIKGLVASYVNTVIVTLLSSAQFPDGSIPSRFLGQIAGIDTSAIPKYTDFSREWYQLTGFKIAFAVLISCFSPHVFELLLINPLMKWWRRRGLKDGILQIELNSMVEPADFAIDNNYTVALNLLFVCLSFSAGMPILIWLCFLGFLLLYIFNKFKFVTWTRKCPFYNKSLNATITAVLPFAILIHLMFSLWIYGVKEFFNKTDSLNVGVLAQATSLTSNIDPLGFGLADRISSAVPIAIALAVVAALLLFEHVLLKLYRFFACQRSGDDVQADDGKATPEDIILGYYSTVLERIKDYTIANYDLRNNPDFKAITLLFLEDRVVANQPNA